LTAAADWNFWMEERISVAMSSEGDVSRLTALASNF
jgi:hypothetical protein